MSDLRLAPLRCLAATLASTTAAAVLGRLAGHALPALAGPAPTPDAVVVAAATVVGALAAGRLALGAALLLLASVLPVGAGIRARVAATARAVAPAALRRFATAGVAVGIGLAGATGAGAAEPDLTWTVTTGTTTDRIEETDADGVDVPGPGTGDAEPGGDTGTDAGHLEDGHTEPPRGDPDPILTPDVPWPPAPTPSGTPTATDPAPDTGGTPPTPGTTPLPPSPAPGDPVVVAPGDTLWALTAARLPGAGPAEVAAAWPVVHEANRHVVGPDPDLIHPGQVLDLGVLGER